MNKLFPIATIHCHRPKNAGFMQERTWHKTKPTIFGFLCSPKNFGGAYSRLHVRPSVRPIRVRPITSLFEVGLWNILQKWPPYWDDVSRATFGSLPWRSRSRRDLAANSFPAHNIVIWRRISKIFQRNDHRIETTCRAQHLSCYLEVQGHSATLQQIRVRPKTLLFEVRFRKHFTEMITILRRCVARNIWVATLKVKVTAWPCSKIVSGP